MSADAFLDSNVLVYQLDARDPRKHAIADRLVGEAVRSGNACISWQVVQECLNVVLRKAEVRLDAEEAQAWLDAVLAPLMTVASSAVLYRTAIALQAETRFGFYDSLVVASALEAGCRTLYTEDLQHGRQIGPLTIVDPFRRGTVA